MSRSSWLNALLFTLGLTALVTQAQGQGQAPAVTAVQLAPRIEILPILSLTISDEAFLKGDAAQGKPVTVAGQLRLAQGTGKLPLVILLHGSSGIGANLDMWAKELHLAGISSFSLDSFTGRGIVSVSTNQAQLGRLNSTLDAYRALELLAKHPRVDPQRIVLMGFSRGGQATLFANMKRLHRHWLPNLANTPFAAYVPFYPDCMTRYVGDTDVANVPVRIHHGVPDNYNPLAPCKAYAERLKAANGDVTITEYPDGAHGFDSPLGPTPAVASTGAQTVRACTIAEDAQGRLINTATNAPFAYTDACVQLGPFVGHSPQDLIAAKANVHGFLRTLFKLP